MGLIAYTGVLYNFLVDLVIFKVQFTKLQVIGVAICIGFSVSAAIYKIRRQSKTDNKSTKIEVDSDYTAANGFDDDDGDKKIKESRKANDVNDEDYLRS